MSKINCKIKKTPSVDISSDSLIILDRSNVNINENDLFLMEIKIKKLSIIRKILRLISYLFIYIYHD